MKTSELNPAPDLAIPAIPVICDRCRAAGIAGDEAFSGIPDILDFTPVPRRARADGWKPEHQRAFIAALAITGSPKLAARTIGKHQFGAESLCKARGGKSFAAAWDAALELARERELARIHGNLSELAASRAESGALADDDGDDGKSEAREIEEWRERIAQKIDRIRRDYLEEIGGDPEKRHAYELLNGPVDWDNLASHSIFGPDETNEPA